MVWVRVWSGWPAKNTGWVTGQPIFASSKKKIGFKSSRIKKLWHVLPCLLHSIVGTWLSLLSFSNLSIFITKLALLCRHGKTGQNFLTWPDFYLFITWSKNGLTSDSTCIFCESTQPKPELFLKTFFLVKNKNKIKTILV